MQAAEQDGFEHVPTRGDHFIYRRGSIVLSIPDHRTLKRGTASRLIKDMTDD